jgi:apolipoprotein D and lipocalin family protein
MCRYSKLILPGLEYEITTCGDKSMNFVYSQRSLSFLLLSCTILAACTPGTKLDTAGHTVSEVDLDRYMGKWYEIASFPTWFQKGCFCSTAEYSMEKGYVRVENSCSEGSPDGKRKSAVAKAFIVPGSGNSRLRVQFQWPFKGDYWIIALDENYQYAMVGHPDRKYLWVLSRTPQMSEDHYSRLVEIARSKGYAVENLKKSDPACLE